MLSQEKSSDQSQDQDQSQRQDQDQGQGQDQGQKKEKDTHHESSPWVEKYRPTKFNDIVLDWLNKKILSNVIETGYFPNLLFYGPPGTGKTTTIMNLVNSYQTMMNQPYKKLIIHLNASDERGIDIIRNQINLFVNSKTMFNQGMKFIILDEVDYMTKNAQQALKYLLQHYNANVRFCLICNYVCRIDDGLQNEFLRLRFNQLPKKEVVHFLTKISEAENMNLSKDSLNMIQTLYNSDIRSMVNFMQSNQNSTGTHFAIINDAVWEYFYLKCASAETHVEKLVKITQKISNEYSIDKKNIIKDFLNFVIRNKQHVITPDFLNFVENITHNQESKNTQYIHYALFRIKSFICKSVPTVE